MQLRKTADKNRYVVVVGCGRVGGTVASKLSAAGDSVVTVDVDESAFDSLAAQYTGFKLVGDATEIAVLRRARAERAQVLLATTDNDTVNLFVAQVARSEFGVPKVLARVYDERLHRIYEKRGILTIAPTEIVAERFLEQASDGVDP